MKTKYSWIELVIVSAIALIICRFIWAKEFIEVENAFIQSFGLPIYSKYFLTIPLVAFVYFGIFQKEANKARIKGKPVVGKGVLIFALCGISVAIVYIEFINGVGV